MAASIAAAALVRPASVLKRASRDHSGRPIAAESAENSSSDQQESAIQPSDSQR